ncbi:MAG: type 4a pilus biogenesis protein PilO [Candidatus Omnitrophota bacterium]
MKNLMDEFNKNQLAVFGIGLLIILILDCSFFIGPSFKSLQAISAALNGAKIQLANAQRETAQLAAYENNIKLLNDKISLYKKKFSTKQQIGLLLESFSAIAKKTGVKIVSVRPHDDSPSLRTAEKESLYKRFPISINALCSYHALGKFLDSLEDADIFMKVTDLKIKSSSSAPLEHGVYILVNTYIINE